VQVDGDCILETPLSCRVSRRTLQLRAPSAPPRESRG
jgi:diacylglycerol kinase family enzyme